MIFNLKFSTAVVPPQTNMQATLNQNVLVLNRLWQAVNICSVQRAFTLLYAGHAEVVYADGSTGSFETFDFREWGDFSESYPHAESVHTVSFRFRIPKVI